MGFGGLKKKIQEAYVSIIQFASICIQSASNLRQFVAICIDLREFAFNLHHVVSNCVQFAFLSETFELIVIDKSVGSQESGQRAAIQCVMSVGGVVCGRSGGARAAFRLEMQI